MAASRIIEWSAGETITAIAYPAKAPRAQLVLAHGAGADQRHPFMTGMATRLAARGIAVTTFNFRYTELKKRAPDRNDALEACYLAVIRDVRATNAKLPLFIGGKSMGGRIASHVAAAGESCDGLVFLGYPLHPPGKPEQLRSAHLPKVKAPMLFVQGSRDAFGTPTELAPILSKLTKGTRIHVVEEGDHSFAVPKRLGRTADAIHDEVADVIAAWVGEPCASTAS